jgi:hypothetical protein
MRVIRSCLTVSLLGLAILVTLAVHPASAKTSVTLYVNNSDESNCVDTGHGTKVRPFCTVQAAADIVLPGQVVKVSGSHPENVVMRNSGTPQHPITFDGESSNFTYLSGEYDSPTPTLSFKSIHDVNVVNMSIYGDGGGDSIVIAHSSRIVLDGDNLIGGGGSVGEDAVVRITSGSTSNRLSRSEIKYGKGAAAVIVRAAGNGNSISSNAFSDVAGVGVSVESSPGTYVTSNTLLNACNHEVLVTGPSHGSSIQNNVFAFATVADDYGRCPSLPTVAEIEVDQAAADSGLVVDYNVIDSISPNPNYIWSGTAYADSAALLAVTGQGRHDISRDPDLNDTRVYPNEGSPAIDSANVYAPGELPTDLYSTAPEDDPLVVNTGTGGQAVDRGAVEFIDTISVLFDIGKPYGPDGHQLDATATVYGNPWSSSISFTYEFGDGTPIVKTTDSKVTHTYQAAGDYRVGFTYKASSGRTGEGSIQVTIVS